MKKYSFSLDGWEEEKEHDLRTRFPLEPVRKDVLFQIDDISADEMVEMMKFLWRMAESRRQKKHD